MNKIDTESLLIAKSCLSKLLENKEKLEEENNSQNSVGYGLDLSIENLKDAIRFIDEELENKDGKFKIICQKCGSENTEIKEEIDYDWDENPYESGYSIICTDCDNTY